MKKSKSHSTYVTNPITLLIEAATRAFNSAMTPALCLILIPLGLSMIQFVFQIFFESLSNIFDPKTGHSSSPAVLVVGVVLALCAFVFGIFVNVVWSGFSTAAGLAIFHRRNEAFGNLFAAALSKFMRVLGILVMVMLYALPWWIGAVIALTFAIVGGADGGIVAAVTIPIGSILVAFFILMAVRVGLRYALSVYALYEDDSTAMAALKESKDLTRGRLMEVFGITSISALVPILPGLLASGGLALLYAQLKNHRGVKDTLPRPHILNYIVLFLIGALLLFIGLILLVVLLVANGKR